MALNIGETVGAGRYTVQALLGIGGMAEVYRVHHAQLGTDLALKVLLSDSPKHRERLMREGRAQASLRHSRIVSVVDVVRLGDRPGLIMEYVDGPSLDRVVDSMSLSLDQVDDIARQVLSGMASAHEQGFVHRDLKPANVLVSEEGKNVMARVADFGLVKHHASTSVTRSGAVMGTPTYMSPEQIRDSGKVDARTDVFALGAVLYELLVGQRAFAGSDMYEVFRRVVTSDYVPIEHLRPDVPERMRQTIERALQPEAEDRFVDAAAMEDAWLAEAPGLIAGRVWSASDLDRLRSTPPAPMSIVDGSNDKSWEPDSMPDGVVAATQESALETMDPASALVDPPARLATYDRVAGSPANERVTWPWIAGGVLVCGVLAAGVFGATRGVGDSVDMDNQTMAEVLPVVDPPTPPQDNTEVPSEPAVETEPVVPAQPVVVPPAAVPQARPQAAPVVNPEPVAPMSVTIQSEPYANVFVDGRSVGMTAAVVSLSPGPHTVRLEPASGEPHEQTLTVRADGQFFCWSFNYNRVCR